MSTPMSLLCRLVASRSTFFHFLLREFLPVPQGWKLVRSGLLGCRRPALAGFPDAPPTANAKRAGARAAVLFLSLAVALCEARTNAQEWTPGGYLSAYGGANLMNDLTVTSGDRSFKVSPDTGYRAGLAMGYELREWFNLEFDTGFQENSLSEPRSGSAKAMPLLFNAVFRLPNPTRFVPFAGLGAGGAVATLDDPAGADIDFVFGYQLTAGVDYELTPQLRFGVLYKFFGTADQSYSIDGTQFKMKDVANHFIGADLSWTF